MEKLLKSFIKMVLEGEEVRIPTQLLSPKKDGDDEQTDNRNRDDRTRARGKDENGENKVAEFCAVGGGAVAGVTGPITGHFTGVPSVKKRRKKKKKS